MPQRLYVCYIFERREVQGFQILHWLSAGNYNDTHKDKDNDKGKVFQRPSCSIIVPFKKLSTKKMFTQGFVVPGPEYFSEKNFSGVTFFWRDYFSLV